MSHQSAGARTSVSAVAVGVVLAAVLVARPLAYGLPLGGVAGYWAFVALAVGFPGVTLCRAAGL
jgi:hypothetical protein